MSAMLDDAILEREQAAITKAKRLRSLADRAQERGEDRARLWCSTSCRLFPSLADFHAHVERWQRSSFHNLGRAFRLRQQAASLLMYGSAR